MRKISPRKLTVISRPLLYVKKRGHRLWKAMPPFQRHLRAGKVALAAKSDDVSSLSGTQTGTVVF